jgi:hypothetical protein
MGFRVAPSVVDQSTPHPITRCTFIDCNSGGTGKLAPCLPAFSPLGCSRRVGQDHGACGGRPVAETDVCLRRRRRGARALEGRWCARARFNRDPRDKQGVVSAARSFGVCYAAGRRVDIVLVRAKRMSLAPRCACRNVCPRRQPGAPAGDIRCLIQSY